MLLYVKPGKQVQEKEKTMEKFTLSTREETLEFQGVRIGYGNSKTFLHTNHPGFAFASEVPGTGKIKCSACRYNVVTLFRVSRTDPLFERARYIAFTEGVSVCPGEVDYYRIVRSTGAVALVDALTVRSRSGDSFLPRPASQALAEAAEDDDAIYDAFNDRAVV